MGLSNLKRCPCGEIPNQLLIYDANQGGKWAYVMGDCCSEWMLEFRTSYNDIDSEECMKIAIIAWNNTKRGFE